MFVADDVVEGATLGGASRQHDRKHVAVLGIEDRESVHVVLHDDEMAVQSAYGRRGADISRQVVMGWRRLVVRERMQPVDGGVERGVELCVDEGADEGHGLLDRLREGLLRFLACVAWARRLPSARLCGTARCGHEGEDARARETGHRSLPMPPDHPAPEAASAYPDTCEP